MSEARQLASLGGRLRELRLGQSLTLRSAALRAGVSHSLLSQVELGRSQPSVSTLMRITSSYGTTMAALFEAGPSAPVNVVRRHERVPLSCIAEGVSDMLVVPAADAFSMVLSVLPPGLSRTAPIGHPAGQQALYLLRGSAVVYLNDVATTLYPGDALWFDSADEHALANPSCEPAELLVVLSGPVARMNASDPGGGADQPSPVGGR